MLEQWSGGILMDSFQHNKINLLKGAYPSVVENIHSAYLSSCPTDVCVHGSTNHQLIKTETRD